MGLLTPIREWIDTRRQEAALGRNMRAMHLESVKLANHRLRESLNFLDNYVDPKDAWDDGSGQWVPAGTAGGPRSRTYGVPFENQKQHDDIRSQCRFLANTNPFAGCILETRVSYVVGTGHVYEVEPKDDDDELADTDEALLKEVVEEFEESNQWGSRQQEIQRRLDRDGECFLRFFTVTDRVTTDPGVEATKKSVKVRFVEPAQVYTPESQANNPSASFGILTEPDDVETVLGYYIDGELVAAKDIQHRKRNVDRNCKRGLSLLYSCRNNLDQALKVIRNAAVQVEIQSAFSVVRKHAGAAQSAVQAFVAGKADASKTVTRPNGTSKTLNFQHFGPGTVIDVPSTTEYEFPAIGLDPSKPSGVVQMALRPVGVRAGLPEYMVSGDASNANYSSTLVAEGPAVKQFQRDQWTLIEEDEEVFDRVLLLAVETSRISKDLYERVKVCAEPPNVIARDELQGAQKNQILANAGVLSTQTWAMQEGLDYDKEQANMEYHVERTGGSMVRAQMPGDIPQDPEAENDRPGQAGNGAGGAA